MMTVRDIVVRFSAFVLAASAGTSMGQAVATFSSARALQAVQEACPGTPATGEVRVRRGGDGSIISIIREGKSETVLHSRGAQCNPLQETIMDVWRGPDGNVIAMVQLREEGRKLTIGESEFRGFRFDIDPTGTYFSLSQGASSSIAAVSRPFRKLLTVDLDVQRVFVQGRRIVAVGNNLSTGRLEYRILQPSPSGLTIVGQGTVGNQPAGVRVLDFDSRSGNLLLAGTTTNGGIGFVMVNLSSGSTRSISPSRPGDDMALFVDNASMRRALTGSTAVAPGSDGGSRIRLPFFSR